MAKTQRSEEKLDTLWFTRCAGGGRGGVPTASGIAYKLGYVGGEFNPNGIKFRTLQDKGAEDLPHWIDRRPLEDAERSLESVRAA